MSLVFLKSPSSDLIWRGTKTLSTSSLGLLSALRSLRSPNSWGRLVASLACLLHFSHLAKRQWKRLLRGIALLRWAFCFAIYVFCLVFEQNSSCVAWLLSTTVVQEAERVCSPKWSQTAKKVLWRQGKLISHTHGKKLQVSMQFADFLLSTELTGIELLKFKGLSFGFTWGRQFVKYTKHVSGNTIKRRCCQTSRRSH